MTQPDQNQISKAVGGFLDGVKSGTVPRSCLICEGETKGSMQVGIWFMNRQGMDLVAAPENKNRIVPYLLCQTCFLKPDKTALAEDKILKMYHEGRVSLIDYGNQKPNNDPKARLRRFKSRKKQSK